MTHQLVKKNILGVDITYATKEEVLEYIGLVLENKSQKLSIVTPNPEMVILASKSKEFREILNNADLALCDGVGLLIASQIMAKPLKERISGIDMMDSLCEMACDKALSIGLLGAGPGVADKAAKCLREKYKELKINFIASEWNPNIFPRQGLDILFIAYGFPKQEQWIAKHLSILPIRVAMGVGGSFDILSGNIRRAPFIVRMMGFEWLYRLIRQPWRWRRQRALLSFIKLVFMAKVRFK